MVKTCSTLCVSFLAISLALLGVGGSGTAAAQPAPEVVKTLERDSGAWRVGRFRRDGSGRLVPADSSIKVGTVPQLLAAIENAWPGDQIELAAGVYRIERRNLNVHRPGTADAPITLRAADLGAVKIQFHANEGFVVAAPYWTFENLDIEGVCAKHDSCDHAFHIKPGADFTTIRNNRLHEFNSMIKGSWRRPEGTAANDVLIEGNEFFNATVRDTAHPVTFIDVVGGDRWTIRGNIIGDFAKGRGNRISYAAFLKGGSRDGVFERNLVICEGNHRGGTRVGLSFGGGGSRAPVEHENGIIRNNVIMHCDDVGIYLNRASSIKVYNNTLFNTLGIDVRHPESSADIRNNLLTGRIKDRNGGKSSRTNNLVLSRTEFARWFVNPMGADFTPHEHNAAIDGGDAVSEVLEDYCGRARRVGEQDIGAIEYGAAADCLNQLQRVFQ